VILPFYLNSVTHFPPLHPKYKRKKALVSSPKSVSQGVISGPEQTA
jgi:hypothetical protein